LLDTEGVFEKDTAEVQHQWRYKVHKYTVGPSFLVKRYMSLTTIKEHEYISHVPYASTVSSLMYVIMCTRPDLTQAVSMVSRYMYDPDRGHWEVVSGFYDTSKIT